MIKSFAEFGRFKIAMDESWQHDRTKNPEVKIWYEQVPIRSKGLIYLHSTNGCAAYVPSIGTLNNMVKAMEQARIAHKVSLYDGEGLIFFDLHDFKKVAKIMGAKRKRPGPKVPISEEARNRGLAKMNEGKINLAQSMTSGPEAKEKKNQY